MREGSLMKIKTLIRNIEKKDKFLSIPLGLTIFCIFVITILFLFVLKTLPQNIPLYYSLPWGTSQLANKGELLILPGILAAISFLNLIIYSQLHSTQLILKRMLLLNLSLIDLIILFAALKIIFIFI